MALDRRQLHNRVLLPARWPSGHSASLLNSNAMSISGARSTLRGWLDDDDRLDEAVEELVARSVLGRKPVECGLVEGLPMS